MPKRVRVLVVDDSAFARVAISKRFNADPRVEVIAQARDGIEAVEQTKHLKPDVVTMDVTMPRMDGIEAVEHIMKECPTPVVMLSALTREGADVTIQALELGAVDFFLKPSIVSPAGGDEEAGGLIEKLIVAAGAKLTKRGTKEIPKPVSQPARKRASRIGRLVVFGSSTGGPGALNRVIPRIPADLPVAILLVQHMPVGFTRSLAERLNSLSEFEVREAVDGDRIAPGLALVAPGGSHMVVDSRGMVSLNQGPQEYGLRPTVNMTMESAAASFGDSVLGVVLTGMGSDGTRGAGLIKKAGGEVIVEDESTCVVYGMPKSIVDEGLADSVLPLDQIAEEIGKRCKAGSRLKARV